MNNDRLLLYNHCLQIPYTNNGYKILLENNKNYDTNIIKIISAYTFKFAELITKNFIVNNKILLENHFNIKINNIDIDYNFYKNGDNGDIFINEQLYIAVKSCFNCFLLNNIEYNYFGLLFSILEKLQYQFKNNKEQICSIIIHKYDKQNYIDDLIKYVNNEQQLYNFTLNTIYNNYIIKFFQIKDIQYIKDNIEQFLTKNKYFI